jgi:hypothetical protein
MIVVGVLLIIVAIAGGGYLMVSAPSSGKTTTPTSTFTGPTASTSSSAAASTSTHVSTSSITSSASTATTSSSTSEIVSSTSITTFQTSSSTTTQTLTAACTSKTSNATTTVLALIPWLNSYPSLSLSFGGQTSTMTSSRNFTLSYSVVYVTSTTYKVDLTYTTTKSHQITAWLLKNGTALAIYDGQVNETGAQAASEVQTYFGEFASVQNFVQEQSLYSNLFDSTGTSSVTIGTQTFTVTNYVAHTLPETIQLCNGETDTLTAYNLSEGTPSGSDFELPTYTSITGTAVANGTTTPFSFTVKITAFTVG